MFSRGAGKRGGGDICGDSFHTKGQKKDNEFLKMKSNYTRPLVVALLQHPQYLSGTVFNNYLKIVGTQILLIL